MIYDGKYAGTGRERNRCLGKERHECENAARYCPVCGSETVFLKKGLLRPYRASFFTEAGEEERLTLSDWQSLGGDIRKR